MLFYDQNIEPPPTDDSTQAEHEGTLRFSRNFLRRYLEIAPAAMAMERAIECEVQARNSWLSPILDIGCGDGFFARILCEDKIDTGIDSSGLGGRRARSEGCAVRGQ